VEEIRDFRIELEKLAAKLRGPDQAQILQIT